MGSCRKWKWLYLLKLFMMDWVCKCLAADFQLSLIVFNHMEPELGKWHIGKDQNSNQRQSKIKSVARSVSPIRWSNTGNIVELLFKEQMLSQVVNVNLMYILTPLCRTHFHVAKHTNAVRWAHNMTYIHNLQQKVCCTSRTKMLLNYLAYKITVSNIHYVFYD